jgi:hypothetical protein
MLAKRKMPMQKSMLFKQGYPQDIYGRSLNVKPSFAVNIE